MLNRANSETANDPHPIEQTVSIDVGGSLLSFVVAVPRYIAGKLTPEDWTRAGEALRDERDKHIRDAVMGGWYFTTDGLRVVHSRVKQSMCDLIYEQFTQRQIEAGNDSWEVPETLHQGAQCTS
jgi:hypothetical protein